MAELAGGTRLIAHATMLGDTEIGAGNVIHPNVVIKNWGPIVPASESQIKL